MTPRWILRSDANSREVQERERLSRCIDEWWQSFSANVDKLDGAFSRREPFDIGAFMDAAFHAIHPDMMWEYGHALKQPGHRLIITPESNRHLYPLAAEIVARAPQRAGWEFYVGRQPDDASLAVQVVSGRMGGLTIEPATAVVTSEQGMVCLAYEFPKSTPKEHLDQAAFILSESLLGEEILDRHIGIIEGMHVPTTLLGKAKPSGIPLVDVPREVDRLIAALRDELPRRPWWEFVRSQMKRRNGRVMGSSLIRLARRADPT